MFAFIINKGTEPGCSETHQIDTKLGQLVEQQPIGNTEMRYSCLGQSYHLGLPPPFGPDSPLALVSLLPGQTGLFYRSQVSRETDSEVRNQGIQSHTNYHTSGDRNRQNVWLKVKQDTAERNRSVRWAEAPCLVAGARPAKAERHPH